MQHPAQNPESHSNDISNRLLDIEARLLRLEKKLNKIGKSSDIILAEADDEDVPFYRRKTSEEVDDAMENRIGEYGLSWLGNVVLFFGITFLLQYIQNTAGSIVSAIMGYVFVAGVFVITRFMRKSFTYMAKMFNVTGHLLLYFVTMRLFFFTTHPAFANKTFVIFLLLALSAVQFYISVRRNTEGFGIISLFLLTITTVLSNTTHIMLPFTLLMAILGVVLFFRFSWWRILVISQFLVYICFLFWFLDNPLMNHVMKIVVSHQFSYLYLFAIAAIYSLVTFKKYNQQYPNTIVLASVIINGLGFSLMILALTLSFFITNYNWIFISVFGFCIGFSILLKYTSELKATPSIYALYSFVSLSIAFYGIYNLPGAYLLLALESLLVLWMALWFRSKLIVVMNLGLFLMLLTAYLLMNGKTDGINFTFALVALVSARVMNWKKERLEITTDLLRNIYLISTFFLILFALYQAVPDQYVTLSWIAAALFYFGMSIILKNKKYRWMALFTFIASALHIFVVDLANIELIYKILAFLVLAVISIFISIYYSKKIKKQIEE